MNLPRGGFAVILENNTLLIQVAPFIISSISNPAFFGGKIIIYVFFIFGSRRDLDLIEVLILSRKVNMNKIRFFILLINYRGKTICTPLNKLSKFIFDHRFLFLKNNLFNYNITKSCVNGNISV